ncbi:hypothetical protein [Halorubrum sp. SP3]|uniref:hypothetical protein n=1 Tax=Halorubrum sp. SP3 TaxID=1537265 RepID=UPI0037422BE2
MRCCGASDLWPVEPVRSAPRDREGGDADEERDGEGALDAHEPPDRRDRVRGGREGDDGVADRRGAEQRGASARSVPESEPRRRRGRAADEDADREPDERRELDPQRE